MRVWVAVERLPFRRPVVTAGPEPFVSQTHLMNREDNEFRLTAGRTRKGGGSSFGQVRTNIERATQTSTKSAGRIAPRTGLRAHFAKGSKGKARPVSRANRRVVVKAKFVTHSTSRGAPLRAHISYLAREGRAAGVQSPELEATCSADQQVESPEQQAKLDRSIDYLSRSDMRADGPYAFYDGVGQALDAKGITRAWADDTRHFRLIISPEDGAALGDLKPFVREVMADLESRLGTRLEWLGVSHFDTDNPHAHVLVRGVRTTGEDLFIPSRLISHGIREQAERIATRVLGPRPEVEIARAHARDIDRREVTELDRALARLPREQGKGLRIDRSELTARLERLERWALAERSSEGAWSISDELLPALQSLADHDAIARVAQAARQGRELMPLLGVDEYQPVSGRLVSLGTIDELNDVFVAIIETGQGELRHARIKQAADLARLDDLRPGALIEIDPVAPTLKPSDNAVARIAGANKGLYSEAIHLAQEPWLDPELVRANTRRLEAMRRMGLLERQTSGAFEVGDDHHVRALTYEIRLARQAPVRVQVLSYLTLDEQANASGPTELDRALAGVVDQPAGEGTFARDFERAMQRRRLFLVENGWMQAQDRTLVPARLAELAEIEMRDMAQRLSRELSKPVHTAMLARVEGVYSRRVDLAQGRMALIETETSARLVPWRPALEPFAGRKVQGLMRGQSLTWSLTRGRGIDLPPM